MSTYKCNSCGEEFPYEPVYCNECGVRFSLKTFTLLHKQKTYWTKEEVIELFKIFNFKYTKLTSNDFHNWIDQNL